MAYITDSGSISKITMGQNRIRRLTLPLSVYRLAAGNTNRMIRPRTTFGMKQIISSVYLVDMRTFRPHAVFEGSPPDSLRLAIEFAAFKVNFLNPDFPVSLIFRAFRCRTGSRIPDSAVIIKKERRINTFRAFNHHRIRPWPLRLISSNKKVPDFINLSTNTVEFSLMKAYCRRKKPAGNPSPGKIQLLRPVNNITNLLPGNKSLTLKNRQPRQIRKRRTNKIVISPRLTDGRIRIKARQDWIDNSCGHNTPVVSYSGLTGVSNDCPIVIERSKATWQSINIILYYCYLLSKNALYMLK